jgi:hypothetical protein
VIDLPEYNVLFAQDLVYHKMHAFFGDKTSKGELGIDNWVEMLQGFQQMDYKIVLPGHGKPTNANVFSEVIDYLTFAKETYNSGITGDEMVAEILKKYPDYNLPLTLFMTRYMLFDLNNSN